MRNVAILFISALFLINCSENDTINVDNLGVLIFKSGYEGSSSVISSSNPQYADIEGADGAYDWVRDLDASNDIGEFKIYFEDGDLSGRYADIVNDPTNSLNHVLQFNIIKAQISYTKGGITYKKGRIQAVLKNNPNLKEFYIKQRVYFSKDIEDTLKYYTEKNITWFTIQEFWNNVPFSDYPFRVTVNINKKKTHNYFHFGAHGQNQLITNGEASWENVWQIENETYKVPFNKWITLETYFKEGEGKNGVFKFYVTEDAITHKIIDVENEYMHHPNTPLNELDGVQNFNPIKLYIPEPIINAVNQYNNNSGVTLYWDDFELWKNKKLE
ncbi:hypothetical protein [Lutibacter sp.]